MGNHIAMILVAALLVCGYLMVVQISAQSIYNRRMLPVVAVIELIVYSMVIGIVGWLYAYSGNDPMIIFGALMMTALAVFAMLIQRMIRNWRRINKIALLLFVIYAGCVFYLTIMGRDRNQHTDLLIVPFRRMLQQLQRGNREILRHTLLNVVMTVPLGILIPLIHPRLNKLSYAFLSGMMVSVLIETAQLVFKLGECDVDDIIANTLGAVIGYLLCIFVQKINDAHRFAR